MKKLFLMFFFVASVAQAQTANDIIERVSMIRFIVDNPNGQLVYRQTKNWCTDFLEFDESQTTTMNNLFNSQYIDIALAYKKYNETYSRESLQMLLKTIVQQEFYFRKLLKVSQLESYKAKLDEAKGDLENSKNKAYNTLFISEEMLEKYVAED